VKDLPPLEPRTYVWIGNDRDGIVDSRSEHPRSYNVRTSSGSLCGEIASLDSCTTVPDLVTDAGQSEFYLTAVVDVEQC